MKQGSYVALLIVMAVVMAVALTAFAIAFDSFFFKSENTLHTITAQFQQLGLKFSSTKLLS